MPISVDTTGFDANSGHTKDRAEPQVVFDASGKSVFGGGTFHHGQATVNGTAVLRAANTARRSLLIQHVTASATAYVGASGVLSTDGWPMEKGAILTLDKNTGAVSVVTTVAVDFRWLEERSP